MNTVQQGQVETSIRDRALVTSHLLPDLRHRAISSGLVTFFGQAIRFVLTLASTAVLARLLGAHDYGLIAMVTTVTGFLRIFGDAGLTTVTVQREGITDAQVSNLFWVNLLVAGVTTVLFAASAPLIAWFYGEPQLIPITIWLAPTFLMAGLTAQHAALLQRQMRFGAKAIIEVTSILGSLVVGVVMAWLRYGYWALVGIQISQAAIMMVMTWVAVGWMPRLPARRSNILSMIEFGAHLTLTSFIYSITRGADSLLIGRVYGTVPLGIYTRAGALLNRPMDQVLSPMHSVFVPVFSRLQTDVTRYRRAYLQLFESIALTSFLATGLLLPLSRPLTVFVLGPGWEMVSDVFAALAPSAIFLPLNSVTTWLFASQARGSEFAVASALTGALSVAAFLAGLAYGPTGVALAYSVCGLVMGLPILYYIAGRSGPIRASDLWRATLRQSPVWGVVSALTYLAFRWFEKAPPIIAVAICGSIGALGGLAFIALYPPSRRAATEMMKAVRAFYVRLFTVAEA